MEPSDEPLVMHFHQDGSVHLLDPAEDAERLVLGRVTPDRDRVRVQVNSHRRPIDTEWLRIELGLTAPLSERLL